MTGMVSSLVIVLFGTRLTIMLFFFVEEDCKNVSLTTKERNAIRAELEMKSLRNSDAGLI